MFIRYNNLHAFSLIELLIVVAIIGALTTLVMTSLGNGRTTKELAVNAQAFISVVREAQNNALTGKQTIPGRSCAFRVSSFGAGYAVYSGFINSGFCTSFNLDGTYTLTNGVSFSSLPIISFSVPHATLVIDKKVVLTKNSMFHTICIYVDGRISDSAGDISC